MMFTSSSASRPTIGRSRTRVSVNTVPTDADEVASRLREEVAAKSSEIQRLQEALKAAASTALPGSGARSGDLTRSEAENLAKELELSRSEAEQLLSSLIERQADIEREAAARVQAEKRVQELLTEVTALKAVADPNSKTPAPRD